MKNIRKSSSPYFRKRDSFESPECSTVIEVNPSCQSEQSMLEKIIFTDQMAFQSHYQKNNYERRGLQQRCPNSINVNRNFGKVNKNYKYFEENIQPKEMLNRDEYQKTNQNQSTQENMSNRYKSYRSSKKKYEPQNSNRSPRQRLNSLSEANSVRNLMEKTQSRFNSRLESYQSHDLKKDYSTQKYNFHDQNDSRNLIDEVKLREIQQKIKRYQQKNIKQAHSSNEIQKQTAKKVSFRDTMESHLNNIQINFVPAHQNKLKKKMTIIDNISFEKENFSTRVLTPNQSKRTSKEGVNRQKIQAQFFDENQRSQINPAKKKILERSLENIYSLVLIDKECELSAKNINLKTLTIEEVKLILGPIFTEVKIRNKTFSMQQFIQRAMHLFDSFKSEQIQGVLKLFLMQTGRGQNQTLSGRFPETHTRVPGRLLSQSKVGLSKDQQIVESKRSEFTQKELSNPSSTFRTYSDLKNQIEIPNQTNSQISQKFKQPAKVTKNVYMQPTQKTEGDEGYFPNYLETYETKMNMNEKALEMMLAQEKSKKFGSMNRQKQNKDSFGDDDELQRLKQLERKFSEHFNSRK